MLLQYFALEEYGIALLKYCNDVLLPMCCLKTLHTYIADGFLNYWADAAVPSWNFQHIAEALGKCDGAHVS